MEVVLRYEGRRQWSLLLERGQYGAALAHCRSATQRNRVYTVQAAGAFDAGQFERAAVLYARTPAAAPLEQARHPATARGGPVENPPVGASFTLRRKSRAGAMVVVV